MKHVPTLFTFYFLSTLIEKKTANSQLHIIIRHQVQGTFKNHLNQRSNAEPAKVASIASQI